MQSVELRPTSTLEFGIYRDGDNNLDESQAQGLLQARQLSKSNDNIQFTVEDTTARQGIEPEGYLRTESYTIQGGRVSNLSVDRPANMASESNLAKFVAHTLDNAEATHAKATWIELSDHGAGDGGGLEADSAHGIMNMPDIANAIADGAKLHALEHPEDANRKVDGVAANQCLMATLGFEDALSRAGVHYLAASPETMLSPGVPSTIASAICDNANDEKAMAKSVVDTTMQTKYGDATGHYTPAAAFDVLDVSPDKMTGVTSSVADLDAALTQAARKPSVRSILREDARAVPGMTRFPHSAGLPWHADRPAIALYETFASDGRLDGALRRLAGNAANAVKATVLAHREADAFGPFNGSSYSDAAGPTVHFPLTAKQVDPWAPNVSETNNDFYKTVGANALSKVLA
ncbi:MAG: hypothetical protein GIW98_02540 [Candidatus Eremiobacteraeota bacterium]|nr:hypothetical protein [Candidatus Eremiobacteraeota bacterium]